MEVKATMSCSVAAAERDMVAEEARREVENGPPSGAAVHNRVSATGSRAAPALCMQVQDGAARLHGNPYRHIVVALVGSELPEEILLTVAKQARSDASQYLASNRERLEQECLAVTCRTPEGPAAESIVDYARVVGADLIAMTTHGRSGLGRVIFGSVAEAVLRLAPCPVLLVRIPVE